MDGDEQRRRQYEQSNYNRGYPPDPRMREANVTNVQNVRGALGGDGSSRFTQAHLLATRPPTTAPLSAGAGNPQDMGGFGYVQGQQYTTSQMQGPAFQFHSEFLQEHQRQPQYPQYPPQMMFNVPQQPPPQSPYDPVSQYQPRQSAAVEVLSSQFDVPQYFNPGESTSVSRATPVPQQYPTALYQQQVPYNAPTDLERSALAPTYHTMDPKISQTATAEASDAQRREPDRYDYAYDRYQRALRETNENTSRGSLLEARASLITISEWLLGHAEDLGLAKDDHTLHEDRLNLWKDFNTCWLALLQRQFDETHQMQEPGQNMLAEQNLLDDDSLQSLGDDLIRLCDGLEKLGLVDYQMGVWEEEILGMITKCQDALSDEEEESPEREPESENSRRGTGN